ncbi:MAG: hypothetical protein OXL37_01830 [Chloroflexota bacterium]|nr:hypothetical protein [Chloroflexota bacterium]MDE2961532.1 hypothetical protein [Chloroflexota bacterium]
MSHHAATTPKHLPLRLWPRAYWRVVALLCICATLVPIAGYERGPIADATAPYRFSVPGWELDHLPDKWMRRLLATPTALARDYGLEQRVADVHEFFAVSHSVRSIDRQLLKLQATTPATPEAANDIAALEQRRGGLAARREDLRPAVEETLESAIAATLESLGFRAWTGPFPPVDTVLSASPTVLVTSPRDRIERQDTVTLRTGLTNAERDRIESLVEDQTDLSALVLDTGGIALYPSIAVPYAGLDFAMEVAAHEWVHHWLWFRPLGRRYFQGGDVTTMNETVANIAGREIGELARKRLDRDVPNSPGAHLHEPPAASNNSSGGLPPFDFQKEMRATRIRVDELLAAGKVDQAESYMEERRKAFVAHGYRLRRLNQAYFAFHGTYADTGAAGVSVVGQQMAELRRRSPSLAEFLRTAAEFTAPDDLAEYLDASGP